MNRIAHYDFVLLMPQADNRIKNEFEKRLAGRRGMILEGEKAERMLTLYSLYEYSDKIIVGSFEEPYGRKLRNLVNCGLATEEEIISGIILGAM